MNTVYNSNPEGFNQYKKRSGWLGTAGKVGLLAGGALAGGVLGARTLSRVLSRGRAVRAGENLLGKVVYTAGQNNGSFTPATMVRSKRLFGLRPSGKPKDLDDFLHDVASKGGIKGWLAKAGIKIDEFFQVPEGHYGVGVGKNKIKDLSPLTGQSVSTKGKFSRVFGDPNLRVVDEGRIAGKTGKERAAEIASMKGREKSLKNLKAKDWKCSGLNCEVFARSVAKGTPVSKEVQTVKRGLAAGAAIGATPGAALMVPRKEEQTANLRQMLQVINGGPGSGFHGHKGIPGHRGGSLGEGTEAPSRSVATSPLIRSLFRPQLSESPQASARRDKGAFTRAARLAEVFSKHAELLEKNRRAKWLPLNKIELGQLADAHQVAADNFRASAEQSTLLKKSSAEEQQARLEKANYHQGMADRYAQRAGKRSSIGHTVGTMGKAFAYGFMGGTPEEVAAKVSHKMGQVGADITGTAIKAGSIQLRREINRGGTADEIMARVSDKMKHVAAARAKEIARETAESSSKAQYRRDLEAALRIASVMRHKNEQENALRRALSPTTRKSGKRSRPSSEPVKTHQTGQGSQELEAKNALLEKVLRAQTEQLAKLQDRSEEFSGRMVSNFESPTANLVGQIRRETLHGRDYVVAPLTMIVPGVLAGSKGPLLYPEDEVAKNPGSWNGMPIVVNHPTKDGMPVEARSPGVLEKYQIGTVFNAKYDGRLIAEGWFDVDRTKNVNSSILAQVLAAKPIELSTGLYTDNEPFEGTWNGRAYKFVARNYRPDHLAILVGSRGACSIKDGCGVLVNSLGKNRVATLLTKIRSAHATV